MYGYCMNEAAQVPLIRNGGGYMSEERINITHMQCHVFRMAQVKWGFHQKSAQEFSENMIF